MFKNPFSAQSKRERAQQLNTEGNALAESGNSEGAISVYLKAAQVDADWHVPAYNLGLHYKNLAQWKESLAWCERAHKLAPDNEATIWNLGIAATALREWAPARMAWKAYGIAIPEGQGELIYPCGITPVRLNPRGGAEVVWAERIDPARARVLSIPFPESGYRYRDIIVNDGAPVGYRRRGDHEVPVFNVLALWQESTYRTFAVEVDFGEVEPDLSFLEEEAHKVDAEVENWTTTYQVLCKACSEGHPHAHHDQERQVPRGPHRIAVAHPSETAARRLIAEWALSQDTQARVGRLELLL
jgi:tetratricopeptide (TPR) repeat protein